MSRGLIEQPNGSWEEVLEDLEACRYAIEEICCCEKHPYAYAWVEKAMCQNCPYFEPEKERWNL